MNLTIPEIQTNLSELLRQNLIDQTTIFEILKIYGIPISTVTKLKTGALNASKTPGEFLRKNLVYIKFAQEHEDIRQIAEQLKKSEQAAKFSPKFIIALNNHNLAAINAKNSLQTLTCAIADLADHAEFFFPLTGRKIDISTREESEVDRRAAEKMNALYDEIEKQNLNIIAEGGAKIRHDLNVFFSRLLFCLFAEDTGIFQKNAFLNAINTHTRPDGSDMTQFFANLFTALDTKRERELFA